EPALFELVGAGFPAIEAEIAYSIRYEMARTIEDVLGRRIGLQSYSWALAAVAAPKVATHLSREFGWSDQEERNAVAEYVGKVRRKQSALGLFAGPDSTP